MAFCYECGSEVAPNDIFCPYCGISLPTNVQSAKAENEPASAHSAADPGKLSESQPAVSETGTPLPVETKSEAEASVELPGAKQTGDDRAEKTADNFNDDSGPAASPFTQPTEDLPPQEHPVPSQTGIEQPDVVSESPEILKTPANPAEMDPTGSLLELPQPSNIDKPSDLADLDLNYDQKPFGQPVPTTGESLKTDEAAVSANQPIEKPFQDPLEDPETTGDFTDLVENIIEEKPVVENASEEKIDFNDVDSSSNLRKEQAAHQNTAAVTGKSPFSQDETTAPEQTENPVIAEEVFKSTFNEPAESEIQEPDFNLTIPYVPPSSGQAFKFEKNIPGETIEPNNEPVQSPGQAESSVPKEVYIEGSAESALPVPEKTPDEQSSAATPIFKPEDNLDLHVSDPPISQFDSVRIMEPPAFSEHISESPLNVPPFKGSVPENKIGEQHAGIKETTQNSQEGEFRQPPSAFIDQEREQGTKAVASSMTAPVMTTEGSGEGKKAAKLKALDEGTILNNRYEVIRKIGGGGMGAVYLASDNNLGGVLRAVKEMVQSYIEETQQEKAINDFKRESMILSTLDHPSIPTIYDYFYDDAESRFYLVMKYINGGDLSARLRSTPAGKIDEKTVVEWGVQIADVLDYLHNRPTTIVYRDLKPSNVMIDGNSGRVMLIDFGIARSVNKEEKGVTAVGTMGYAPPELFSGNVEPRSDIYSLGSTMFHLLTGADPQSNPLLIFDFQKNPRPRQINSQLSDQMERILMRAVEYNADARFASAADLRQALQEHLENLKANKLTFGVKEAPQSVSLEDQPVFCGFCGQRIMATDMFCAFCGAKQPLSQRGVHSEIYSQVNASGKIVINSTNELSAANFDLDKDLNLIGRRDPMSNIFPELDLSKYDPQTKISRRHALIKVTAGTYLIEDLGSSNGTLLISGSDSTRLLPHQPRPLTDGDKIRVGDTILNFYLS